MNMAGSLKEDENVVFHPKQILTENTQTKGEVVKKNGINKDW